MSMTYTELTTNIQDICENTFTADQLAMFAQLAEQRIYNTVQFQALRKTTTPTLSIGDQYLSCPADFLAPESFAIVRADGEQVFLLNKDVNFIRECYPTAATQGEPKHYAIFGPQSGDETALRLIFGPTPNAALVCEFQYFYYPESIVTASTTWLGQNFDLALLNGALVEAIRFMKGDPDLVQVYQGHYDSAIALLKNLGDGKQRQDTYRSGTPRTKVV